MKNIPENKRRILYIIENNIPFRFISEYNSISLINDLECHEFKKGQRIITQGDKTDDRVFIIEKGEVESIDNSYKPPRRINTIRSGHYFGERTSLFSQPRDYDVYALEEVICWSMTGKRFIRLLHESKSFSQAFSTILRDKQGIFHAFDHFIAELMHGITSGYINIHKLVPLYKRLLPALHPKARKPHIDFTALGYASRRLPENVGKTFAWMLTDDLPAIFTKPDKFFNQTPTQARRRQIWEMMPGKNMVLLRNGISDFLDIISCICLYAVESKKIRYRLHESDILEMIHHSIDKGQDGLEHKMTAIFEKAGFSKDEQDKFKDIWGNETIQRLHQIIMHHEVFSFNVHRQTHNYNSRRSELWTVQIGKATQNLLGHNPSDLPKNVKVHIISSNTHSVTNCLSPFLIEKCDEILEWAEKTNHPYMFEEWQNKYDLMYALSPEYKNANPGIFDESPSELEWGILRLKETVSTGIQVQLIDCKQLIGKKIDPEITPVQKGTHNLIVNIDYAFGDQAEEITRNLIMLFGKNLASINIMGKAGSLIGRRGDVLVPTAFIQQTTDLFQPLPAIEKESFDKLKQLYPPGKIHCGPLLTVAGTLLQNRQMLYFYRHIWNCIGLEMEASFYYRQIQESKQLEVLPQNIDMRFLYYVSDLPLNHTSTLSNRLMAYEGLPPLYAITRSILDGIFS